MNILHISPYFPDMNENHAGGVCMGKQIETLRKRHNVYVLTFIASEFDKKIAKKYEDHLNYKTVSINRWTRLVHVLIEPFLPNFFAARSSIRFAFYLVRMIKKHHIHAIHAEYASMGQYFWIVKALFPSVKIHLIEHDITIQSYKRKMEQTSGIKRWYFMWQCKRILRAEGKYCNLADVILTFNTKDSDLIKRYYKRADVIVINPYYGIEDHSINARSENYQYGTICFMGQMGRAENYEAADRLIQISKKVKKKIPELEVYIIGNNPPEELKKKENDFIHVTGFVENVDQYLVQCQVAVFPLTLGAGIKLKVLRSLALGVPVITSGIGAEGIDEDGEVIVLAETDGEFENSLEELIMNYNKSKKLSEKSRRFVQERFGWCMSEKLLGELYKE